MTNKKYGYTDPRFLNEGQAHESVTAFHDMKAREEAEKIASRYKNSPVALKAISKYLSDIADKAYADLRQTQQNTPEARERERIRQEILAEQRSTSERSERQQKAEDLF
jgi:hypothetical protein